MKFGEKLKALREKHHFTQTDVAKALGVTQRAISYYENNNVVPNDPEALNKLAKLFGITLDELLRNEGQKSKLHTLVEKLIADTQTHFLEWAPSDEATFLEFDDTRHSYIETFNHARLPKYSNHTFSPHESYITQYKNGGYLIAKLISPQDEIEIALFAFLYGDFSYIADNNSIKQIDDLYLLLLNSSYGVNSFIDEYLADKDDEIPF